jgi:hypothetical protein
VHVLEHLLHRLCVLLLLASLQKGASLFSRPVRNAVSVADLQGDHNLKRLPELFVDKLAVGAWCRIDGALLSDELINFCLLLW